METLEGGCRWETLSTATSLYHPAVDLTSSVCQHAFIEMDMHAHTQHAIVIGHTAQGVESFLIQDVYHLLILMLFHIHMTYFLT